MNAAKAWEETHDNMDFTKENKEELFAHFGSYLATIEYGLPRSKDGPSLVLLRKEYYKHKEHVVKRKKHEEKEKLWHKKPEPSCTEHK